MNGMNEKHQNLTNASDNAVFRSNVNKDEQDLPVRKKSNARTKAARAKASTSP